MARLSEDATKDAARDWFTADEAERKGQYANNYRKRQTEEERRVRLVKTSLSMKALRKRLAAAKGNASTASLLDGPVFDTAAEESQSKSTAPNEEANKKRKKAMYDEEEVTLASASTKRLKKKAAVHIIAKLTKQAVTPSSLSEENAAVGAEEKEEEFYSFKKSNTQIIPMTPCRQEKKKGTTAHYQGTGKQQQRRSNRQTVVNKKGNIDHPVHLLSSKRKRNKKRGATATNSTKVSNRRLQKYARRLNTDTGCKSTSCGGGSGSSSSSSSANAPSGGAVIKHPNATDVLFGRHVSSHPGNRAYINIIRSKLITYGAASDREKKKIALSIVHEIKENWKGRFLNKDEKTELWMEVMNDEIARQKVGRAFCDLWKKKRKSTAASIDSVDDDTSSNISATKEEPTTKLKTVTNGDDANYDSDGDFKSWKEIGNWCWLVAGNEKKSSKVATANAPKVLQVGERNSIRVAVKNSLGDDNDNQNDTIKNKQTSVLYSHRNINKPTTAIRSPRSEDVLVVSGRSKSVCHPGNLFYKSLIEEQLSPYEKCTDKKQKRHIEALILDRIKSENGRFLKKEFTGSELWKEISDDEVLKKVGRSLYRLNYTPTKTIRSPLSEDVLVVAGRSNHPGNNMPDVYKKAVEEAQNYMLKKYGREYVDKHRDEEIVSV